MSLQLTPILFDVLQKKNGFPNASWSNQAEHSAFPINVFKHIPFEICWRICQLILHVIHQVYIHNSGLFYLQRHKIAP